MEEKKQDFRPDFNEMVRAVTYVEINMHGEPIDFVDPDDAIFMMNELYKKLHSELSSLKEENDRLKSQIQELRNR